MSSSNPCRVYLDEYERSAVLTESLIDQLLVRYPTAKYRVLRSDLVMMAHDGIRWSESRNYLVGMPIQFPSGGVFPEWRFSRRTNRKSR